MNIKISDVYRIDYDGMGYTLYKTVPVRHRDGTSDTKEVIEGFYGSLSQAVRGLHCHDIQGSPITTVEEMRQMEDEWVRNMCAKIIADVIAPDAEDDDEQDG